MVLRNITGVLPNLMNLQLHEDLQIETIQQIISQVMERYIRRIYGHINSEALMLFDSPAVRHLKWKPLADIS